MNSRAVRAVAEQYIDIDQRLRHSAATLQSDLDADSQVPPSTIADPGQILPADALAGVLLAHAFPERLAVRIGPSGDSATRFKLASGRAIKLLHGADRLHEQDMLCVCRLTSARAARSPQRQKVPKSIRRGLGRASPAAVSTPTVLLAAPLPTAIALELFPQLFQRKHDIVWRAKTKSVQVFERVTLGGGDTVISTREAGPDVPREVADKVADLLRTKLQS